MPATHLHLRLPGLFRQLRGDQPVAGLVRARLQHRLAYPVLHRAAPVSRQELAFLFRPDSTDQQALKNLRTLLTLPRRASPHADHPIAVTVRTMHWHPYGPVTADVVALEATVSQAGETEDPARRVLMSARSTLRSPRAWAACSPAVWATCSVPSPARCG